MTTPAGENPKLPGISFGDVDELEQFRHLLQGGPSQGTSSTTMRPETSQSPSDQETIAGDEGIEYEVIVPPRTFTNQGEQSSFETNSLLAEAVKSMAAAQVAAAKQQRSAARWNVMPRLIKYGAIVGGLSAFAIWAVSCGNNDRTPPPPAADRPTPEAALDLLEPANDLIALRGDVSGTSTASFRFQTCLIPTDAFCFDSHLGHDVATTVSGNMQYIIDGDNIDFRTASTDEGDTYVVAVFSQNEVEVQLASARVSHSQLESQFLADLAAAANMENGVNGAVTIATNDALSDVTTACNDSILDAGEAKGDAVAGAFGVAARHELERLNSILEQTAPDAAAVVGEMIADDRPIGVDFEQDGFTVPTPAGAEDIHEGGFSWTFDVTFGDAKECKLSSQASQQLGKLAYDNLVQIVRYDQPE